MGAMDHLEGHAVKSQKKNRQFIGHTLGDICDVKQEAHGIVAQTASGSRVQIDVCRHNMFHLRIYPLGEVVASNTYMVDEDFAPHDISYTVQSQDEATIIKTKACTLRMEHAPFAVVVRDNRGEVVFATEDNVSWNDRQLFFNLKASEDETFYGTGLRRVFPLNSHTIAHRIERNTWDGKSTPFYVSSKGYGFFLNTSLWDTSWSFEASVACMIPRCDLLDAYIMVGDMPTVTETYRELVGATLMPPKWSLGYWNGRYSYRTKEELLDNAKKFREKDIPCDLIFLDLMWRGVYIPMEETDLTWDYECFPDPEGMVKDLQKDDFHLFTHVNTTSNVDARDFSNPDHVKDWRDKIIPLIKEGTQGFMVDGGEGKGMNDNFMSWNVPGGKYYNGMYPEEMANIWGLLYNKTVVTAMRDARPDERMLGLTRAATAGSQKYGVIWSGDHTSEWETLAQEIMAGMHMSLSGFPYWTFDIGGIDGKPKGDIFLRWLQVGCFVPVARTHGVFPREPWLYGTTIEDASRKILKLRMKLIPYLYSIAYAMHQKGTPMARPLMWHYPEDDRVKTIWDQWTLGRDLLVAPVYHKDTFSRSLYLPEGQWLELATGIVYDGKQDITVDAPLDSIPLFLRKGAIIPMGEAHNHTKVKLDRLDLYIYPGESNALSIYEDDGITSDYEAKHSLTHVASKVEDGVTTIEIKRTYNGYDEAINSYEVRVLADAVKSVEVNGAAVDVIYKHDAVLNRDLLMVPVTIQGDASCVITVA